MSMKTQYDWIYNNSKLLTNAISAFLVDMNTKKILTQIN